MANKEHIATLKQGVTVWNAWRRRTPHTVVSDLIEAQLRGADLTGVNLQSADLRGADLSDANLLRADLIYADLRGANLTEANLEGARLEWATLDRAKLTRGVLAGARLDLAKLGKAHLEGAILEGAILNGATLYGATIEGAMLNETVLANVEFRATKGLETCQHMGPSILDHRTLQRSGRLPLVFLRGCGLPDRLIDYLPSLLEDAIQYYSCFISYSSKDEAFAKRLHTDLQNNGVRCWFAPEDMKIGDKFRQRIDEAIHVHERLLLILSEHSVSSEWVEKEVETAFEKEQRQKRTVLFPVRLDDAVMECDTGWSADIRRTRHIGDFRPWKDHDAYQQAFSRVLRDLKAVPQ